MISSDNFQLRKTRTPGEVFSDSLTFYRSNFKNLMVPVLIVLLPIALVSVGFSIRQINHMTEILQTGAKPGFSGTQGISSLISLLYLIASYAIIFAYIKSWQQDENGQPQTATVLREFGRNYLKLVLFSIPIFVLVVLAMFLIVIPGIWLAVVLAFVFPICVFEGLGFGDSYSKAFRLVKNSWWQSFAALLIPALAILAVSLTFQLVNMLISGTLSMNGLITSAAKPSSLILGTALSLLLQPLFPIALSLQYFNLSEEKEGSSLELLVDGLGTAYAAEKPVYTASPKNDESF